VTKAILLSSVFILSPFLRIQHFGLGENAAKRCQGGKKWVSGLHFLPTV
jgi:hypothetical protein